MNVGMSGVSFVGNDIGGFANRPSPELFARWIEVGAFLPFSRVEIKLSEFGVKFLDKNGNVINEDYVNQGTILLAPSFYIIPDLNKV